MLGPTTNLENHTEIVRQLLELVEGGTERWPRTFAFVNETTGTIHVRNQVLLDFMTDADQNTFALNTQSLGVGVSIETGGALCGKGSGAERARSVVAGLRIFLDAGGSFRLVALESIFSRTHASCASQSQEQTASEIAAFAAGLLSGGLGGSRGAPSFYLYDALPHMTVGAFPRNDPKYDLDLGTLLTTLQAAMRAKHVRLEGYLMDCPYEFSSDPFPNASAPMPAGSGYRKIAAAAELVRNLGLRVGKTFNSQSGGQTSDTLFYHNTLKDVKNTLEAGVSLDVAMVESWYAHPLKALPEDAAYTTTFTAKAAFGALSVNTTRGVHA